MHRHYCILLISFFLLAAGNAISAPIQDKDPISNNVQSQPIPENATLRSMPPLVTLSGIAPPVLPPRPPIPIPLPIFTPPPAANSVYKEPLAWRVKAIKQASLPVSFNSKQTGSVNALSGVTSLSVSNSSNTHLAKSVSELSVDPIASSAKANNIIPVVQNHMTPNKGDFQNRSVSALSSNRESELALLVKSTAANNVINSSITTNTGAQSNANSVSKVYQASFEDTLMALISACPLSGLSIAQINSQAGLLIARVANSDNVNVQINLCEQAPDKTEVRLAVLNPSLSSDGFSLNQLLSQTASSLDTNKLCATCQK